MSEAEEEKIDFSNPAFIIAVTVALAADLSVLLVLGLAIPAIGFVFFFIYLLAHYASALISGSLLFKKLHTIPKLVFLIAAATPVPLLTLGLLIALLLQNKLVEQIAVQAALLAAGAVTGGTATAAGEAALAGAEAGEIAAESAAVARAGAAAARGAAGAAEEITEAGISEAELAAQKAREATEVFGGETATPTELVEEELLGEKPLEQISKPEEEPFAKKVLENLPENEEEEGEEGKEEEEIVGSRLGGAYAEEEQIQKSMEEVAVENGSGEEEEGVDLRENVVDLSAKRKNIGGRQFE